MKMKFNFIEIFPEKNWINFLLLPLKLWAKQNTRLWMWVQFSHSVVFCSLRPHGLQHTRLPWPSPVFPVFHHLLEFAQTHACWVSDAIQTSHPLSSPSPPAFYLSQHQGSFLMSQLFESGGRSIEALALALALPMNIQVDFLEIWFITYLSV